MFSVPLLLRRGGRWHFYLADAIKPTGLLIFHAQALRVLRLSRTAEYRLSLTDLSGSTWPELGRIRTNAPENNMTHGKVHLRYMRN